MKYCDCNIDGMECINGIKIFPSEIDKRYTDCFYKNHPNVDEMYIVKGGYLTWDVYFTFEKVAEFYSKKDAVEYCQLKEEKGS